MRKMRSSKPRIQLFGQGLGEPGRTDEEQASLAREGGDGGQVIEAFRVGDEDPGPAGAPDAYEVPELFGPRAHGRDAEAVHAAREARLEERGDLRPRHGREGIAKPVRASDRHSVDKADALRYCASVSGSRGRHDRASIAGAVHDSGDLGGGIPAQGRIDLLEEVSYFFEIEQRGSRIKAGLCGVNGNLTLHPGRLLKYGIPPEVGREYLDSIDRLMGADVDLALDTHPRPGGLVERRLAGSGPLVDPGAWDANLRDYRRRYLDMLKDFEAKMNKAR
ncbi:MAG: hypothetical protein Q8M76_16410 [Spirochaetaceae bacterium]|nr:hypothetical protein [Spirochaetaceae bacterium]